MFDPLNLLFVLAVAIGIFFQGLRKIPAKPPCVALLTIFGDPIPKYKGSGWRFFFLCPFVVGYILIDISKKNSTDKELPPQQVISPDKATFMVPLEITWEPQLDGEALIEYISLNGEEGIWSILAGITKQRLRQWGISSIEGPQNADDLLKAGDEAVGILIKAIAGQTLISPSNIPTSILLHYFQVPRPSVRPEEVKIAGANWELLEGELRKLNDTQLNKLKDDVEQRRQLIADIMSGNGHQNIPHLAIKINRLNIGEIKPTGKYAEALDLKIKEEKERDAESYEITTELNKAKALKEAVEKAGEMITLGDAFQRIMSWKATREGHGFVFPGKVGQPTTDLVKKWLVDNLTPNRKNTEEKEGRRKDGRKN